MSNKSKQTHLKQEFFIYNKGTLALGNGYALIENHAYDASEISVDLMSQEYFDKLKKKKVYKPVERFLNDIGDVEDRGEAPIAAIDPETGEKIRGIPHELVNAITIISEDKYLETIANRKTPLREKSARTTPWRKGVTI